MAIVIAKYGGFITVGMNVRATIYQYAASQLGLMDMCYTCVSHTGTGCSTGELAAVVQSAVHTPLLNLSTPQCEMLGTKVAGLWPNNTIGSGIADDDTVSAGGTALLPTQVRGIIKWNTSQSGRAYTGRVFTPFPHVEACGTLGEMLATYQVFLGGLAAAIFGVGVVTGAGGTSTMALAIYHRASGKTGVPVKGSSTVVIGYDYSPLWATQRRSGDRGKANQGVIT